MEAYYLEWAMPNQIATAAAHMTKAFERMQKLFGERITTSNRELAANKVAKKDFDALMRSFDEGLSRRMQKISSLKVLQRDKWCADLILTIEGYRKQSNQLHDKIALLDGPGSQQLAEWTGKISRSLTKISESVVALRKDVEDKALLAKVVENGKKWSTYKDSVAKDFSNGVARSEKHQKSDDEATNKGIKELLRHVNATILNEMKRVETIQDPATRRKQAKKQLPIARQIVAKAKNFPKHDRFGDIYQTTQDIMNHADTIVEELEELAK